MLAQPLSNTLGQVVNKKNNTRVKRDCEDIIYFKRAGKGVHLKEKRKSAC